MTDTKPKQIKINLNLPWIAAVLTVVFITLKLLGYIAWSWFWVFSPLIIAAGIAVAFLLFFFVLAALFVAIAAMFAGIKR